MEPLNATKRDRILVEADDLDLAELAGFLQHLVDPRGVVGVEADQAGDVGHRGQRVLHIALGTGLVDLVAPHVDQLDMRALQDLLHALDALVDCRAEQAEPRTCRRLAAP
jgi:hypothetical protein